MTRGVAAVLWVALAGCSSSGPAEPGGGGGAAGTIPSGAGGGVVAGAAGASGLCNDLMLSGDFVSPAVVGGTIPTPSGGTIADGTYVLTKLDSYTQPLALQLKTTLRVKGTKLEVANVTSGTAATPSTTYINYDTSQVGTSWVLDSTCPTTTVSQSLPYTATATTLLLFSGGTQVSTYTKS